MQTHSKLKMELHKDGKVLKYVSTEVSHRGLEGHLTDVYRDEDGKIHYEDRLKNEITWTTYPRNNTEGKMISFAFTFQRLLTGLKDDCTDVELDRYILQCESHIKTAKSIFEKQYPEDYEDQLYIAIVDKIEEKIKEFTLGEQSLMINDMLERLTNAPRMLQNSMFHNALKLATYKFNHPELQVQNDPQITV